MTLTLLRAAEEKAIKDKARADKCRETKAANVQLAADAAADKAVKDKARAEKSRETKAANAQIAANNATIAAKAAMFDLQSSRPIAVPTLIPRPAADTTRPHRVVSGSKPSRDDLTKLTVADLRALASCRDLKGYSKWRKDELINALLGV